MKKIIAAAIATLALVAGMAAPSFAAASTQAHTPNCVKADGTLCTESLSSSTDS